MCLLRRSPEQWRDLPRVSLLVYVSGRMECCLPTTFRSSVPYTFKKESTTPPLSLGAILHVPNECHVVPRLARMKSSMAASSSSSYWIDGRSLRSSTFSYPAGLYEPWCKAALLPCGKAGWPRASSPAYAFVRRYTSRCFYMPTRVL